ncbi:MAG TPA: fatty acid hydroxylase [Verrucomicrobiae bacterium]|nr:fatty acid hydroxylase [Verrucomicrobiae bacterium]
MISTFFFWTAIGCVTATIYGSLFEWILHKFLMHRPIGPITYPFKAHALVHHRIFKYDDTYHLINEKDKQTIPMAWWNGPVLVAIASLPFVLVSLLGVNWGMLCGAALAISCYYGAYEYIHWCMHLPKRRHVERSGIFFRLNGHHLLHHRYMNKNFNVVLPLADLCLGTLLLRSKVHFRQASGPSVPNVQPKQPALVPSAEAH